MAEFHSQFLKNVEVIWKMKFENITTTAENIPENASLSPTVQMEPCYDYAVRWARDIFKILCPDEEWMPAMPDPQDIIIESSHNEKNE